MPKAKMKKPAQPNLMKKQLEVGSSHVSPPRGVVDEEDGYSNNNNNNQFGKHDEATTNMNIKREVKERSYSDASTQDCSSPSSSMQYKSSFNSTINSTISYQATIEEPTYFCFEIQQQDHLDENTCHTCGCSRRASLKRVCFCDACCMQGCLFKVGGGKEGPLSLDDVGRDLPFERTAFPMMIPPALDKSNSVVGCDDEMVKRISNYYGLNDHGSKNGMKDGKKENTLLASLTEFSLFVDDVKKYEKNVVGEVSKSFKGLSRKNEEKLTARKEMIRDLRQEYRNNYSKKCKRGYWLTIVNLKADGEKRRLQKRAEKRTRTRKYARDCKASLEWGRERWLE